MNANTGTQGFTLLELMVSLCIFTIISIGAYFMLSGMLLAQGHVEDNNERLAELQRWLMISNRDILQIAPATFFATPESKEPESALHYDAAGSPLLTFSRRGWSNPLGYRRSELQRVEYRLDKNHVERDSYPVPPAPDGGTMKQPLLGHIKTVTARFLDQKQQWNADWKPEHPDTLPQAIEFSVDIEGMGAIRQLFPIASMPDDGPKP